MYEYVCDRLIPGCSHKETGDTPEALREKAIAHLHEHHDMGYIDDEVSVRLTSAIVPAQAH
jgi:predicted small metal-binding protein